MIFAPPPATRFDLNFRLLGFPVRIHPFFWLSTVLLGTYGGRLAEKETAIRVLAFVLAAFISILVHELGHALTIRWYGRQSQVILYHLGGLATIEEPESFLPVESESELRPRAKIFIALAGPAAGFLLAGGLIGALYACRFGFEIQWGRPIGIIPVLGSLWDKNAALAYLVFDLLFINIFWGAMNLLPVYPLDGGQVARELFSLGNPRAGLEKSLLLSTVTGAVVAVLVLTQLGFPEGILPALMFGLLAIASYRALTQVRAMGAGGAGYYGPEADDDDWWKK